MEVFNDHKHQLLQAIDLKIHNIDSYCSSLKHQIYLYSDQRLQGLLKKKQQKNQKLEQLQIISRKNKAIKEQLILTLSFLKKQNTAIKAELAQQQKLNEAIERQLIFIDEKNKEEQPHVNTYLNELEKHKQAAQNIQYAKSKLKQLQSNYLKESQEVQYKYRMITLMKDRLKGMKSQNNIGGLNNKHSDQTGEGTQGLRDQEITSWMGLPRATEESCREESEGSTFREQI